MSNSDIRGLLDASSSLMELLAGFRIRVPRGAGGTPPALLALAVVAMLAGVKSCEGFVQFGKERGWAFLGPLGFTTRWGSARPPTGASSGASTSPPSRPPWPGGSPRVGPGIAALPRRQAARGSRDAATGRPPRRRLRRRGRRRARPAPGRRQDQRAQGRPRLRRPPRRRVVTGDAMFTHRDVCAAVAEGGATICSRSRNQPTLLADIKAARRAPAGLSSRPTAGPRA
ncbi:MAG: hypothetical protein U0835_06730 [Isosphaeraceae bacterium]